ncbi:MAG: urea ABC transporter permease subunit UrtB, partial [Deltaproteobacteria bacterium]
MCVGDRGRETWDELRDDHAAGIRRQPEEAVERRVVLVARKAGLYRLSRTSYLLLEPVIARHDESLLAVHKTVLDIESYLQRGNLIGTAFRGFSLAAVLLVAALGLAITFGLMGIINMAHGEIMMVGAYAAYVTQNLFMSRFGAAGSGFDAYFLAALPAAFLIAALTGLALE